MTQLESVGGLLDPDVSSHIAVLSASKTSS